MKEETLRRFFTGEVSAKELADELRDAVVVTGRDSSGIRITPMDNAFRVSSVHLQRVCDAVLENKLPPEHLATVGLCVVASDSFDFEIGDNDDRARDVAQDWADYGINYPLTRENVTLWKRRLKGEVVSLNTESAV